MYVWKYWKLPPSTIEIQLLVESPIRLGQPKQGWGDGRVGI